MKDKRCSNCGDWKREYGEGNLRQCDMICKKLSIVAYTHKDGGCTAGWIDKNEVIDEDIA